MVDRVKPFRTKPMLPRFNEFSIGRAAVLLGRGASREQVAEHYFQKYGKAWGVRDPSEMSRFLFCKGKGGRPNVAKMFEGKSRSEIKSVFAAWRQRKQENRSALSERAKKQWEDPAYAEKVKTTSSEALRRWNKTPEKRARHSQILKARWSDPAWRAAHVKMIPVLSPEARNRGLKQINALWKDPAWRANQIAKYVAAWTPEVHARRAKEPWKRTPARTRQLEALHTTNRRRWDITRNELLAEFDRREISQTYDPRSSERVGITTRTPVSAAVEREQKRELEKALGSIRPEEAQAITTTFFEGNDTNTTAQLMGITHDKLERLLSRAYRKLAHELRGYEFEFSK